MDKQFNLDYGFINKFNEESENGQRLMVEQLANLPKRSDDQHFQKIIVSHFFDTNDLQAKSSEIKTLLDNVLFSDLKLNNYFYARNFVGIIGQTTSSPIPNYDHKNEPLVYHLYKLITGRSLKRDLNVQQSIINSDKVAIAPVISPLDEIIAAIDLDYDIRFEIEEVALEKIKAFLSEDSTVLAAKIYLSLVLRGYFEQIDLKDLYEHYFNRFNYIVNFALSLDFGEPSTDPDILDIVDNDDRDALELTWMLLFLKSKFAKLDEIDLIKNLIKRLSLFEESSSSEAHRYLANIGEKFTYIIS